MKKSMTFTIIAALLSASSLFAQASKKVEKKEIIIERNEGGDKEKMVIEIDGNSVTINGKPAKDYKGKKRIIIDDDIIIDGNIVITPGKRLNGLKIVTEKKALLGVVTEKGEKGAKINSVSKESGAEKAGLKKGDIITSIGSKIIDSPEALSEAITSQKPGDEVVIQYLRDGQKNNSKAVLGETSGNMTWNKEDLEFNFDEPRGFSIPRMRRVPGYQIPRIESDGNNLFLFNGSTPKYGMDVQDDEEGRGVKVTDVEAESNATKAGLQKDDIITEAEGIAITDLDKLREVLNDAKGEKLNLKIKILRNNQPQELTLKVPRKIKSARL